MCKARGYTILELLVVMAIMGLLGTVATGGYRAMVRGMEERSVIQNVNAFVSAAFQRAQIDQRPVVLYFWNEPLRDETDTKYGQVVGRAVAVRPWGRISNVNGSRLVDEFNSPETLFPTGSVSSANGATRALYALDNLASKKRQYTFVSLAVSVYNGETTRYGTMPGWAYYIAGDQPSEAFTDWKPGSLYGLDFQQLQLSSGYVFGSGTPQYTRAVDVDSFVIRPGEALSSDIVISALRQKGTAQETVSIGRSDKLNRNGNVQ